MWIMTKFPSAAGSGEGYRGWEFQGLFFCYLVTLLHRFSKGEAEIPGEFIFLDFVINRRKRLLSLCWRFPAVRRCMFCDILANDTYIPIVLSW